MVKATRALTLYDKQDDIVAAVVAVEEAVYEKGQVELWKPYLLDALSSILERWEVAIKGDGSSRPFSGFEGTFGGNRYTVRKDGSIWISRAHSNAEHIRVAAEVGIGVTDY